MVECGFEKHFQYKKNMKLVTWLLPSLSTDKPVQVCGFGYDYKNPLQIDVIDRYLWQMGNEMIPDEALPSLESFCLVHPGVRDKRWVSEID